MFSRTIKIITFLSLLFCLIPQPMHASTPHNYVGLGKVVAPILVLGAAGVGLGAMAGASALGGLIMNNVSKNAFANISYNAAKGLGICSAVCLVGAVAWLPALCVAEKVEDAFYSIKSKLSIK